MNTIRQFSAELLAAINAESDPAKQQAIVESEIARLMFVAKSYRKADRGPDYFDHATKIIVDNMSQRLVDYKPY